MKTTDDRLDPCAHCGAKIMFKTVQRDVITMCSGCKHIEVINKEEMVKAKHRQKKAF